jgi:hypothetical protein
MRWSQGRRRGRANTGGAWAQSYGAACAGARAEKGVGRGGLGEGAAGIVLVLLLALLLELVAQHFESLEDQ